MTRSVPLLLVLLAAMLCLALPARADVLELKDGRLIEGLVVKEGDSYHVQSRFGATVIPVAKVKAHTQAKSVDEQIQAHLASLAPEDAENRALLARWLGSIGRDVESRELAEAVLEMDPESAVAHEVLGHIRHQGVWRTPDEAKRAEGLEKHGDKWYTREEWANQSKSVREKALEYEKQAEAARLQKEVNKAVRLMMSPNKALRKRGRARLESMAKEFDNPSLAELAQHVDAYVEKLDEMKKAVAASGYTGAPASGSGYVMGEFRATVSKLKRPIETFETSLASNIGGAPVRIQLPELEVIRVRTVGVIPVVVH